MRFPGFCGAGCAQKLKTFLMMGDIDCGKIYPHLVDILVNCHVVAVRGKCPQENVPTMNLPHTTTFSIR